MDARPGPLTEHPSEPLDRRLRERLASLGPEARARLLRALNVPHTGPEILIGALYPHPEYRPLADFLIDLEDDLPTLAAVVSELRLMELEDYRRSKRLKRVPMSIHPRRAARTIMTRG